MSKKITHEIFLNRITEKFDNIEVLSEYKSAKETVTFRCKTHDFLFNRTPDHMRKSVLGCPICSTENVALLKRKTHEEFLAEFTKVNRNVELLGRYKTNVDKILVKCRECGHTWNANPSTLLVGNGCKKCAMKYVQNLRIKTHEQFLKDVEERNPKYRFFEIISNYQKDSLPVDCRCDICGRVWSVMAHNLVNKRDATGCPYCNTSKGELTIMQWLEINCIHFQWQKEFDGLTGLGGGKLSYDFYIPSHNLLIEYQGEFHDGNVPHQTKAQFEYQQEHDRRKREYAQNHGIELLEIWYKDFNNIDLILDQKLS